MRRRVVVSAVFGAVVMVYAIIPGLGGTAGVFVLRALSGEGHDWRPLLILGLALLGVQAILVFVIYPIWDRRQQTTCLAANSS